ncbi:MAG: NAD(+)/NADH kinase [Rhodothermales bacterium]
MIYGITGNTQKDKLWKPTSELASWLSREGIPFRLNKRVSEGLSERGLLDAETCMTRASDDLAGDSEIILSFGGDGTMLMSAHEVGTRETPILGINIGRLGFLADIEVGQVRSAVQSLEAGNYRIEERLPLAATLSGSDGVQSHWALNEFVLERSGSAGLISIRVMVDGVHMNDYWTDGLIISTPTGSTAYSMSVGGPIVAPGSDVVILTPLAPHSLTVRPIVLPASSTIEAEVLHDDQTYLLAYDGRSRTFEPDENPVGFRFTRADHHVRLVKLPEQHYFQTLRSKLMWGVLGHQ